MKKSLSLILFLALFLPSSLYALTQGDAQLYFDQTSKNILVDENFSISLLVNSGEQAVNAFEATINIPDYLEIVSASYDSSICQLFIYQPKTTNNKIDFKCGLPHGYEGPGGRLVNISLKALKPGSSLITLSNARVLANDGFGTNVLGSSLASKITVEPVVGVVDAVSIKVVNPVVPPTTSFEAKDNAPIDNIATTQQVEITAEVGFSITVYLEDDIAKVETNWNLGYGISKDANSYTISANI